MKSLRWGIIGPGKIAHDFAKDLSLVQPKQKITAVLGAHKESAENFAKEVGAQGVYIDLPKFIKNAECDVVYIATPHPQHFQEAKACLENSIPVLCEKPITLNEEQIRTLSMLSEKNNTFLMEGMWLRFLPHFQKLLSLVAEDAIGKVISIRASMGFKAPKDENNRYFNPELGGGSLLDLGIYPVFLSHLLLGLPSEIKAFARLTDEGIDEACSILLDYKGKAHSMLDSTLLSQSDQAAEIAGEKGIIRILHPWYEKSAGIELQLYNEEKQLFPTNWEGHGFQYEIEEVLKCLDNNGIHSQLLSSAFSCEVMKTLDSIREQVHIVYNNE